ncbi:MAG: cytochrome P450 [Candidatus Promineifilaceae bacterium]|nr:cytochrome P450 [Candidatus Promineifilaceae bacterium]
MAKVTPPLVSGALPFLGHVLDFRSDRTALLRRGYQEHGPIFALDLAGQKTAILIGPTFHRRFFQETDKSLSMDKPYRFMQAIFGDVAFLASHETYLRHRPVLHAPFKRQKMVRYIEIMQREVQRWLDDLGDSGEFEINAELGRLVQNVAGYALMGKEFQQSVGAEFWSLYSVLGKALDPIIPPNWPLPKFIRRDRAKERMVAILRPVIAERRRHPERYDDFLQDIIDTPDAEGNKPDDDLVIGLILALNFAGHETTAGQAAWTIIQILQHPSYCQLVESEVAEKAPPGTTLNQALLNRLEHVIWAVRETERTQPSADMQIRYVEEDLDVDEHVIPAGWLVQTAPNVAHRLPELFTAPHQFDPLRFAPDRQEDRQDRFALIGFGGGMHKCTGMNFANNEMAVITTLLLQQYDLQLMTTETDVEYGLGANRPTETWVRYQRTPVTERVAHGVSHPR